MQSEQLIPTFSVIIQELLHKCDTDNEHELYSACLNLWLAVDALNKVTCCLTDVTYLNISMSNEMEKIAGYIEYRVGINPITNKDFAKW